MENESQINNIKLNRNVVEVKKLSEIDDPFVNAPPKDILSFMWDLTAEIWSLRDNENVKRRLQRNVTNLIRK